MHSVYDDIKNILRLIEFEICMVENNTQCI